MLPIHIVQLSLLLTAFLVYAVQPLFAREARPEGAAPRSRSLALLWKTRRVVFVAAAVAFMASNTASRSVLADVFGRDTALDAPAHSDRTTPNALSDWGPNPLRRRGP